MEKFASCIDMLTNTERTHGFASPTDVINKREYKTLLTTTVDSLTILILQLKK